MHLRNIAAAGTIALALGSVVAAQQGAAVGVSPVKTDGKDVTLVGCVVKGDGGYVLSGVGEGFTVETTRTTVATSGSTTITTTTRSTAAPAVPSADQRIIYWLDDDDHELEDNAGRKVELRGKIEGDIDTGEIEVERENNMIELEIKAKGDTITIKLPDTPSTNAAAVGTSGMVKDRPQDIPYLVRKLDVKSVKRIADSCM